LFLCR